MSNFYCHPGKAGGLPTGFIPLSQEIREVLTSAEAAPHLGLKPATLTEWAKDPNPPMKPLRYNKRKLMWRVSEIRRLLAGE